MDETFPQRGLRLLNDAWRIALDCEGEFYRNAELARAVDQVFAGSEAGYHKALIVQGAGKAANPELDAQSMQKGDGRDRSWDARLRTH